MQSVKMREARSRGGALNWAPSRAAADSVPAEAAAGGGRDIPPHVEALGFKGWNTETGMQDVRIFFFYFLFFKNREGKKRCLEVRVKRERESIKFCSSERVVLELTPEHTCNTAEH